MKLKTPPMPERMKEPDTHPAPAQAPQAEPVAQGLTGGNADHLIDGIAAHRATQQAQASESVTPDVSFPPVVKTADGYSAVHHGDFIALLRAYQHRGDKLKAAGQMVAQLKHEAQTFQLVPIEQCPKCGWGQPKQASESAEARDAARYRLWRDNAERMCPALQYETPEWIDAFLSPAKEPNT